MKKAEASTMQELTRSMLRFSWAMPMLGMNLMVDLAAPGEGRRPFEAASESLDAVTSAAQAQLGPELQRLYDTGARVGDDVVNAMFGFIPTGWTGSSPAPGGRR